MSKVGILMGSKSDFDVVKPAVNVLKKFGVETEVRVISAHRTPEAARDFAQGAADEGYGVIICGAGKAAHLAGAFAGNSTLPVIGIPVKSKYLDGIDALLSTVQMPTGIPVATVAIDGAGNAALLAIQMLAIEDSALLVVVVDGVEEVVELVVAELLLQILWQSLFDVCNGLLVIEVFHCEFVVVHSAIILNVPQTLPVRRPLTLSLQNDQQPYRP